MSDKGDLQFVDTNVLVYAYDRSAGAKRDRAQALIERLWSSQTGCISIQVLQEFFVAATQKVSRPLGISEAAEIVRDLAYWQLHAPIAEDVLGAIEIQKRYRLSFWDAMILWSAECLNCATLLSEDLNPGQTYSGVVVKNPFRG